MALHFFRGAMAKEMPEHPLSGIWRGIDDGFFPMLVGKLWAFTYRAVSFFLQTECDECKGNRGNEFLRANELSFKISTFFGWLNGSSMKLNSKLCPFTFFSPSIYKYILTLFFPSIRFVATISFFSPYSWPLNVCVHIPNQWLGYSSSFFFIQKTKKRNWSKQFLAMIKALPSHVQAQAPHTNTKNTNMKNRIKIVIVMFVTNVKAWTFEFPSIVYVTFSHYYVLCESMVFGQ